MTTQSTNTIAVHDCSPETATMRDDVLSGLSDRPKYFPSQYLYDERGARLFEAICDTDEYYPTRTEIAILRRNMAAVADRIGPGALVVEPGSGSGVKTQLLLGGLEEPAGYVPIDVAREQLVEFATQTEERFPDLEVLPVCADFTSDYELPPCGNGVRKRIAFFPGSTIGNFTPTVAVDILRQMAELSGRDGGVLIGVDLKKDADILEPAYNDAEGVSRDFAMNILVRLNRELNADFNLKRFTYQAPYDERHGRIEMALVSRCRQVVHLDGVGVMFDADEPVRTEYSYKYAVDEFAALARRAGLTVTDVWTDPQRLFSVQYLVPSSG